MGNGVFFFGRQLRHGLPRLGKDEHRVIAEAARAPGIESNLPFAFTARGEYISVGKNTGDAGDEAGRSSFFSRKVSQEQRDPVGVAFAALAAVPRGIDARCAAESVYNKPRVIGDCGLAQSLAGGVRLNQRVFFKGRTRFLGFMSQPCLALRDNLRSDAGKQRLHFLQLAAIV